MFCTSSRWRWEPRANVLPAPAFLMNKFRCDEIIFAYYQLYVYAYYGWSPCNTFAEASRNFASFRSRIDSFLSFLDFSNEEADGKAKFNVVLWIIKLINKIYSFRRRVQFFFFFYCFIEFFVELIKKRKQKDESTFKMYRFLLRKKNLWVNNFIYCVRTKKYDY